MKIGLWNWCCLFELVFGRREGETSCMVGFFGGMELAGLREEDGIVLNFAVVVGTAGYS